MKKINSFWKNLICAVVTFCMAFGAIAFNQRGTLKDAQAETLNVSSVSEGLSSSSASSGDFTFKSYSLTSLVDAITLENTDPAGTVNSALTTKDLVWLPIYENVEITSSNFEEKSNPTGINTMIYGINDGQTSSNANENNQLRKTTPTDYAVANNANLANNNHSSLSQTQGTTWGWLRSTYDSAVWIVSVDGRIYTYNPDYSSFVVRPALQFNINSILSAKDDLDIQIDSVAKTIVVPNIMYPQTRVRANSDLERALNSAFNNDSGDGTSLQNGMSMTGRVYTGYNTSHNSIEYMFDGNYYARTKVKKNSNNNLFFDGSTVADDSFIWVKVEPIKWYITNWANMPKAINSNGDGTATGIVALSQFAIINIGEYYTSRTDTRRGLWQNSRYRAYLNSYDLAEQNNGTNGSNDETYLAPTQASFKGNGFIEQSWHDLKPSLIVPTTLQNNGFNSDGSAIDTTIYDLTTVDQVWLPSSKPAEDPTNISKMLPNSQSGRKTTATDWALANNTYIRNGQVENSAYYWLRTSGTSTVFYYVVFNGDVPYSWYYQSTATAVRPCLQFNLDLIISAGKELGIFIDAAEKTIVFPQIMYPQTKVSAGSSLEKNLNSAYNGGVLQNGMIKTGNTYAGYEQRYALSNFYSEYYFDGNFYVYARINRVNGNTLPFTDEGLVTIANGTYAWFKVEPIVWYISNWDNMPTEINPNSTALDPEMVMRVISKQAIVETGRADPGSTRWQDNRYRAYLNGYDLWEENTFGNGNSNYKADTQTSFKGNGFVDTVWHANYTTAYIDNADGQDGAMGVSVTTPVKTMGRLDEVLADNPTIDTICFVDSLTIDDDFVTNYGSVVDFRNYNLVGNNGMQKALIKVTASTDVVLKNLKIDGSVFSPITITGSGAVTIVDSVFNNCTSANGAAIQATDESEGALVVSNCTFVNCSATTNGGAISNAGSGALTVENCKFESCSATTNGGAIYQGGSGNVTIANCIFGSFDDANANGILDNNESISGGCTATNGGAIYKTGAGFLSVDSCTFYGCSANNSSVEANGGAIYVEGGTTTSINLCRFYSCTAKTSGGAVYQTGTGSLTVTSCTFGGYVDNNANNKLDEGDTIKYGCSANSNAGAVCSDTTGGFSLNLSTFYGGNGRSSAGALYLRSGNYAIANSYFYSCSASTGGAIYQKDNIMSVKNCTFGMFNDVNGNGIKDEGDSISFSCTATYGGAIETDGEMLLSNCNFYGCDSSRRGAVSLNNWRYEYFISNCSFIGYSGSATIYLRQGTLNVDTCLFNANVSTSGAIYAETNIHISNSTFIDNKSSGGGAIYAAAVGSEVISSKTYYKLATQQGKSLIVENCVFDGNTATGDLGGGAILSNFATTKITGCVFNNNSATSIGGAITYQGAKDKNSTNANDVNGTLTIENSTFTSNSTSVSTAINIYPSGTITNDDVTGSYTAAGGGAVCILGGNVNITGSTFGGFNDADKDGVWDSGEDSLGNSTTGNGGAIWVIGSSNFNVDLTNFICNTSKGQGGVVNSGGHAHSNRNIPYFRNCKFMYNVSVSGGVLYAGCTNSTFVDCIFEYNCATNGGIIYVSWYSDNTFSNCYLASNYANSGGIFCAVSDNYVCNGDFNNCVIEKNSADNHIFYYGKINFKDSIIEKNIVILSNSIRSAVGRSSISVSHGKVCIKNNFKGDNLVESFDLIKKPTDNSSFAKIVKNDVFDNEGNISSNYSAVQADWETKSNDLTITAASGLDIWLSWSAELNANGTVIANATNLTAEAFKGIHYDNADVNHVKLYLQDGKIYAKVVDESASNAFAYTANDYVGYYDSNAHGIDVKVYNLSEGQYKIQYCLNEDFTSGVSEVCPTFVDATATAGVTVYFRIFDMRTGVTQFEAVTGSRIVKIVQKTVSIKFDNATFSGFDFGGTLAANAEITDYLKGVIAVDSDGNAVSGKFYLTYVYTPSTTNYAFTTNHKLKFEPYNINYATVNNVAIGSNITPVFEYDALYYNADTNGTNGKFYTNLTDANSQTGGFMSTFENVLPFLKKVSTVYFVGTYAVNANETLDLNGKFVTFTRPNKTYSAVMFNVASGKNLTILAEKTGSKLVVSGYTDVASQNPFFVNAGTLKLSGTIELKDNKSTSAVTQKNGAGINSSGTLDLFGVKFTGLTGHLGGAIYTSGSGTIKSCYFASNGADTVSSLVQGQAIYIAGDKATTIENCTMIANNILVSYKPTITFKNNYMSSTIVVDTSEGGELKLTGSVFLSTLQYFFYDGSSYLFKVTDTNLSGDSKIALTPRNTSKDADLVAVYNQIASATYYNTIFSLSAAITNRALGVTSTGYYGLIDTTASASSTPTPGASGTIGASGSGNVELEGEIDLYDLIVPTTLENNGFDSSGNQLTGSNLNTTDYVWLPSSTSGTSDPTSINTMVDNIFGEISSANRQTIGTDYVIANGIQIDEQPDSGMYWLRTSSNDGYIYRIWFGEIGNDAYWDNYLGLRPVTKFNIEAVKSYATIDIQNKTITIPQIMYPQTKVTAGSTLETNLNNAYNDGSLQNGMMDTGRVFAGYNTVNGSGTATNDSYEYYFNGNYYTRTKISKRNNSFTFSDELEDGATIVTSGYVWIKVEPIVWYITNWNDMPGEITNNATSGTATEMIALSQKVIANVGVFNHVGSVYRTMWQNSDIRAYLNGYDLAEQNDGTNGNATYMDGTHNSFKGNGFIDTIWHYNDKFVVYFDPVDGDDANNGVTPATPVKTTARLMEVLNSNSALNTVCFKNTLTVDSATTLDFGGRYLTSFDDGTNAFTGDFFNVTATGAVTIKNIKIDGNATDTTGKNINSTGGLRLTTASGSNVTLSGLDISNCTSRGLTVTGSVTLTDSKIWNNTANLVGGGVQISGIGSKIKNSEIFNNFSSENGGGIFINICEIENCKIYNNKSAKNGGGLSTMQDASLIIANCEIYNNLATEKGGGIYVNSAGLSMSSSLVYNNTASNNGGGLCVDARMTLTGCKIYNNTTGLQGGGARCGNTCAIVDCEIYSNSSQGDRNGVGAGIYSAGNLETYNTNFCNNQSSNAGGAIRGASKVIAKNCNFYSNRANGGAAAVHCSTLELSYCDVYDNAATNTYGGGLNASTAVIDNCKLHKNGYGGSNWEGGAILAGTNLIVSNSYVFENRARDYGAGLNSRGTMYVYNCVIYKNECSGRGAGIESWGNLYVYNSQVFGNTGGCGISTRGTATIESTNVFNNKTTTNSTNSPCAGIYSNGVMTINNCNIYNNIAEKNYGSGVWCNTTTNITNSNIYNNISGNGCGAIYSGGAATIKNSNVYNNKGTTGGGAMQCNSAATLFNSNFYDNVGGCLQIGTLLTATNCRIYNNTYGNQGAGVSARTVNIANCEIFNNYTTSRGGGIFSGNDVYAVNCKIYNNKADMQGGSGIYINSGDLIAEYCDIYNNYCSNGYGAGLHATNITVFDCNIYDNFTKGNGGGVYAGSNLTAVNCNVYNNKSTGAGGGLWCDATLTAANCNIYSNTSGGEGGGTYSRNLTMDKCNVFNNKATTNGGGVCGLNNSSVKDSNIYSNIAGNNCGGVYVSVGNLTIVNSNVYDNHANNASGGALQASGSITVTYCNVYANSSQSEVIVAPTSLTITKSNISGNVSSSKEIIKSPIVEITNSKIANNNSKVGLFTYSSESASNNLSSLNMEDCIIYGNTFSDSGVGYGLISVGQSASGSATATITNCEFHSNVGLTAGADASVVCNDGGVVTIDGCRFSNNLTKTGENSYAFCGVVTKGIGSTNITNSNVSHNRKNNLGTSYETGSSGLIFFEDSALKADLDNIKIENNNLGENGAIVANNSVWFVDSIFEGNTGKLAKFNDLEMFNIVVSDNNFDGKYGIEATGSFEIYNIIVEGNQNGSALKTSGAGLIEKIVADSNSATHTVGNKGAVIYNTGILALSNSNTLFSKFLSLIFTRGIELNPQTEFTNNTSTFGGAIYNAESGNLTLNSVTIGTNGNGNVGAYGGAVYNAGMLTINGATLQYNLAQTNGDFLGNGGGVYNRGTLVMNSGVVNNNTAQNGGGFYNLGTLTINSGEIKSNKASLKGAGICNATETVDLNEDGTLDTTLEGKLVVNYAEISLNSLADTPTGTNAYGAGVYNDGDMTINNGLFEGNTRGSNSINSYGGAVYAGGKKNYIYGGAYNYNKADNGSTFYASENSGLYISNVNIYVNSAIGVANKGYVYYGENGSILDIKRSNIIGDNSNISGIGITGGNNVTVLIEGVVFDNVRANGGTATVTLPGSGTKLVIKNSTITKCFGNHGQNARDGVIGRCSEIYIYNTKFIENYTNAGGYMDLINGLGSVYIDGCEFLNNKMTVIGQGSVTIKNSVFRGNEGRRSYSTSNGNGSVLSLSSNSVLENNLFENNFSPDGVICFKGDNREYSIKLLGTNIIRNNYSIDNFAGVFVGVNSKKYILVGIGGRLIVTNNYIVVESTVEDYDVKFGSKYYKYERESNLSTYFSNVNAFRIQNGLQEGSRIGISIYSSDASFDLSSLVGTVLFKGTNVTSTDFEAFYMDNNAGVLKLQNNEFVLASTNPVRTAVVSDKIVVVDGKYHSLTDKDFKVYNSSGEMLVNTETETKYSVKYSLEESGDYADKCPEFITLGINTIYYKVYLEGISNPLASGSTTLKIVKKVLSIIENPTALLSKGSALPNATFVGGLVVDNFGNSVAGTWAWAFNSSTTKEDTIPTDEVAKYNLTFVPGAANAYENTASGSVSVTFKWQFVTYKTVESVKGFYNSKTGEFTGVSRFDDLVKYIGKNGIITLEETYVFEESESLNFAEDVFVVWSCDSDAFQVGSGTDITVDFVGSGRVTMVERTIQDDIYLFRVNVGAKLILSNLLVSNFKKVLGDGSSSNTALIYNSGTIEFNGANFMSNTVESAKRTSLGGGIIISYSKVIFNSGTFANNTLNCKNGTSYGAVIYNFAGETTFNGGTFSNNTALGGVDSFGGVICNFAGGKININSGVFSGNSANKGGVIAELSGSRVVLSGGTMMFNKASSGAVLYVPIGQASDVHYNGEEILFESEESLNKFNDEINITTLESNKKTGAFASVAMCVVMLMLICLCFVRAHNFGVKKQLK